MDVIDQQILGMLQDDGGTGLSEIARQTGLSRSPCWRRVKKLEDAGVISGRVVLLNADKLGLPVLAIVKLRLTESCEERIAELVQALTISMEVVEAYQFASGEFSLKIRLPDLVAYKSLSQKLRASCRIAEMEADFVMRTLKLNTKTSLSYAQFHGG